MKLDFNLQVTQKRGIALTAQVQQAIKLLHMTNMEIQEYVDDQFQDNPFIETAGEFGEQQQAEKIEMQPTLELSLLGASLSGWNGQHVIIHITLAYI